MGSTQSSNRIFKYFPNINCTTTPETTIWYDNTVAIIDTDDDDYDDGDGDGDVNETYRISSSPPPTPPPTPPVSLPSLPPQSALLRSSSSSSLTFDLKKNVMKKKIIVKKKKNQQQKSKNNCCHCCSYGRVVRDDGIESGGSVNGNALDEDDQWPIETWLFKNVSRKFANAALSQQPIGTFMIRSSMINIDTHTDYDHEHYHDYCANHHYCQHKIAYSLSIKCANDIKIDNTGDGIRGGSNNKKIINHHHHNHLRKNIHRNSNIIGKKQRIQFKKLKSNTDGADDDHDGGGSGNRGKVKHYKIFKSQLNKGYFIFDEYKFNTLFELVNYYRTSPDIRRKRKKSLPSPDTERIHLITPVSRDVISKVKIMKTNKSNIKTATTTATTTSTSTTNDQSQISKFVLKKPYIIDSEHIRLIDNKRLGYGNFGVVYRGEYTMNINDNDNLIGGDKENGIENEDKSTITAITTKMTVPVALKTLKNESIQYQQSLIQEALIMCSFAHENLVKSYGVCMLQPNQYYLVTEYICNGALDSYLKRHNPYQDNHQFQSSSKITLSHLTEIALQITSGMQYLVEKKCIHRDLAARNCLVGVDYKSVKITDFGLTRALPSDTEYYRIKASTKLPIRWTAIEVMTEKKYTIQSDIWSFGVLLHEIYTYGKVPYDDEDKTIVAHLEVNLSKGYRMSQSTFVPDSIYELMLQCWNATPECRPDFGSIENYLEKVLQQQQQQQQQMYNTWLHFD